MKPNRNRLYAAAVVLAAQLLIFGPHAAHAGSVTPMPGGGAKTIQLDGLPIVLEGYVMRVVNGRLTKVNMTVPNDALVAGPVCGAFYKGQKMADCGSQPAIFEGAAQGTCPAGTTFDIGTWSCWKCPPGFIRNTSFAAIDSDRACNRLATRAEMGNQPEFQKAQHVGDQCPAGSFYDTIGGGSCWSCPSGYNVNVLVHVQQGNKCTRPGGEQLTRAIKNGRPTGLFVKIDCPSGQFLDIWDGGWCWNCPAGYNRTGNHINSGQACSRAVAADHKPATQRPGGTCEAGTFTHTYNVGMTNSRTVCLKCPEGYDQVILEPGDSPRKCQTTPSTVFAKALKDSALTCKPGQEFDLIGLTTHDIATRPQFRGQTKPKPVASGTCWSCPSGYYRSLANVKGNDACPSTGIDHYLGVMREPGLFGLGGAAEVLAEILEHDAQLPAGKKGLVEQAIAELAAVEKIPQGNRSAYMQQEATKVATRPQESGVAAALVFARLLTALAEPGKATAAERRLVASFTQYVKMKRLFMAHIAQIQFNTWRDTTHWRDKNQVGKNILDRATMSAYGRPPSFEQAALLTVSGQGALGMAASEVVGRIKIPIPALGEVAGLAVGLATGGYQDYTQGVERALYASTKTAGEILFGLALTAAVKALASAAITNAVTASAIAAAAAGAGYSSVAVGSSIAASTALASSGIGIGVGAVMIVASMQMEQLNQFLDAPVKVGALLADARETSTEDLARMGKTGGGMTELLTYWSTAVDAGSQMTPTQKTAYDSLVKRHALLAKAGTVAPKTAAAAPAVNWARVQGAAVDIGVGANGAVWHIGTNKVAGGYGIYRWDGRRWVNVPGGAVRVAVDPQGNAWVTNDQRTIFRWDGRQWVTMPGLANDLAIGANGAVWHIGTNKVPGGYGIYRWDGRQWVNVPGGATQIAVDPKGNAWVANDKGHMFRWDGRQWQGVPGLARDIGVGANGTVWHIGTNQVPGGHGLYYYTGSGWTNVPGGLTVLAVGPDGKLWGANDRREIFQMR